MVKKDLFTFAKAALNENAEQIKKQICPTFKGVGVNILVKLDL